MSGRAQIEARESIAAGYIRDAKEVGRNGMDTGTGEPVMKRLEEECEPLVSERNVWAESEARRGCYKETHGCDGTVVPYVP